MTYDEALQVQRRHESELIHQPGVTAVIVKQRGEGPVLEVSVDPDMPLPDALTGLTQLEGLPVVIERQRYTLQ
jgi:hypothetical protein